MGRNSMVGETGDPTYVRGISVSRRPWLALLLFVWMELIITIEGSDRLKKKYQMLNSFLFIFKLEEILKKKLPDGQRIASRDMYNLRYMVGNILNIVFKNL